MKKAYIKPEIMFENFSLSTNIAGDCDRIVGNPAEGTCGIKGSAPNKNVFSSSMTGVDGCQVWLDGEIYDSSCYHNPNEETNFFNS